MGYKFNIRRINWKYESEIIKLTMKEFNDKLDYFRANNFIELDNNIRGNKTVRRNWLGNIFAVDHKDRDHMIYAREGTKLVRYRATVDDTNNESKVGGHKAFNIVNETFKEEYGISMRRAFGVVNSKFVDFCQRPIIKVNRFIKKVNEGCCKSDVSSAYPFQLTKVLPDAHNALYLEGFEKPNKDYPFAFYPDTNHIAIYNELDTHKLLKHKLYSEFANHNTCKDEHTVLMKASEFSLADIMQDLYDNRDIFADNKRIMNSLIGFMRSVKYNKGNFMAHVAAVTYVRHMKYMCDVYDEIKSDPKNIILFIATDCFAWQGNQIKSSSNVKELGCLYNEYEDCCIKTTGKSGQYLILTKEGKILAVKHQGYSIDEQEINREEDFDNIFIKNTNIRIDSKTKKFTITEF